MKIQFLHTYSSWISNHILSLHLPCQIWQRHLESKQTHLSFLWSISSVMHFEGLGVISRFFLYLIDFNRRCFIKFDEQNYMRTRQKTLSSSEFLKAMNKYLQNSSIYSWNHKLNHRVMNFNTQNSYDVTKSYQFYFNAYKTCSIMIIVLQC